MTPDEVRAIRARLGLTQVELARLCGLQGRTWRRFEGGQRAIDGTASRLLRLLVRHPELVAELAAMGPSVPMP
jgi:putative transcriptional regulator